MRLFKACLGGFHYLLWVMVLFEFGVSATLIFGGSFSASLLGNKLFRLGRKVACGRLQALLMLTGKTGERRFLLEDVSASSLLSFPQKHPPSLPVLFSPSLSGTNHLANGINPLSLPAPSLLSSLVFFLFSSPSLSSSLFFLANTSASCQ